MTKNGLTLANRNDFVLVESHINDNFLKVDNDIDATWGGTYRGYIQDVSEKVVDQRYIDKINGKAYKCIKAGSNINTTEFFEECNVNFCLTRTEFNDSQKTQITRVGNLVRFAIYRTEGLQATLISPNGLSSMIFTFPFALKNVHYAIPGGSFDNVPATRYLNLSANKAGTTANDLVQLLMYNTSSEHTLDVRNVTFYVVVEGEV